MAEPESQPSSPPRKRRWLQYSLRTMLVLTPLVAVGLGYVTATIRDARRQKQVAEALKKEGIEVETEPIWLGRTLGDESLVALTTVCTRGLPRVPDDVFDKLEQLGQLRMLALDRLENIDAELPRVRRLNQVQELLLNETGITDVGLVQLKSFRQVLPQCRIHWGALRW